MRSHSTRGRRLGRIATVAVAGFALTGLLAACSGGSTSGSDPETATQADIDAALQEESTITYWSWTPSAEDQVAAFEEEYPNVTVKLVNAGTGNDQYTKLQNAIKAGSGAPDVAQIEYFAMPQFALSDSLVDLSAYGFDSLEDTFSASTWGSVNIDGGLYGLPQDSGPMALFYNKAVFDQYGIAVPTTWDEYVAAAAQLHAADPTKYITADTGDAGLTTSLIWQAGGTPYKTDGTDITIDLQDQGAEKWTGVWNQLVDQDLLSPISSWSDEWYKGLGDGTIATLLTGAWMPGVLESGVADSAGDWRVAPMPTYDGTAATAENGGGGQSVLAQSENKLVAAGFVQWLNAGNGVEPFIESGGFPSTTADLESDAFLSDAPEYFGGQKINEVLGQASKDVVPGWSYLPFQTYANSIYSDTVGQSYASKSDLNSGLQAWQDASVSYGNEQGFTVNK